jgi:hypothetical protein
MMAQTQAFRDEVKRRASNPKPAKPPLDPDSAAAREIKGGFEDRAMAELATQDRRATKPKRDDKPRMVADDIVTTNSLATHLGCTRQNIARLVAEAIIEQRSDGCFDQTASRLKYIRPYARCSGARRVSRPTPSTARSKAGVANPADGKEETTGAVGRGHRDDRQSCRDRADRDVRHGRALLAA